MSNDNFGPSVIDLEIPDEIRGKQLITSLQSNAGKSIIVRLNHRPDNKIVELYPVVLGENEDGEDEKWTDTMNSFEAILEEKGVDDEDRKIIRWVINYNSKKIVEHCAEQKLARMTAAGKAKRARLDKINNSTPKEVSVSKALMMHEGKVKVKGMFVGGSTKVENMYTSEEIKVKDKSLTHVFAGLPLRSYDIAAAVERIEKVESDIITPEDEEEIRKFLAENKGKVIHELAKYMPSHVGDMDAKEGILMCAASTGLGPKYRINILLIGETGLAKTTLAKGAIRLVPGSKFTSAMDATTNSLICVVDPDTGHFRFGPLITNGAICVVDEVGRILKENQARLLSAMGPDGMIYFGRYGINRELAATEAFILTANPDSSSGRFRQSDKDLKDFKIDINEFPFLGPFRDRIDITFIFKQDRSEEYLENYGSKFEDEDNHIVAQRLQEEGKNFQFPRKWLIRGRDITIFKWTEEAKSMITEYFMEVMTPKNSQASNRLHDTLRKCCMARARLKLKDTIEKEDAIEVIRVYKKQSKYWSDTSSDPRDIAYNKIIEKLSSVGFRENAYTFEELLQAVCKDNPNIDGYTKIIDKETGKRVWGIEHNHKVRYIYNKFNEKPTDDRIKIISPHPLTLAWKSTYRGSDKPSSDASDASDAGKNVPPSNSNKQDNDVNKETPTNGPDVNIVGEKSEVRNVRNVSKEQQLEIAGQIFDSLVSSRVDQLGVEKEVLESRFIEALTASGFDSVDKLINDMVRDGFLEKVITEKDGVLYDMLRKVVLVGATR